MGYVLARNFLSEDELFNNGIIVYHDTLIDLHNVTLWTEIFHVKIMNE